MITLPRLLAALSSGLVLAIISPPLNADFLHWVAFVPLLWALRDEDDVGNVVVSYLAGYCAVSTLFFWLSESIIRFSNIPAFASLQLVHLFAFVFALPYALVFGLVWPLRRRFGAWWVVLLPAVQVASEFLAPALFPYYQGVSQYRNPYTWQLASVIGVYGVSYLVLLTSCALGEWVYRAREGRGVPVVALAATAAVFLANLGFGAWRYPRVEAQVAAMPRIRVSQLQQGITMEQRMAEPAKQAMLYWLHLTRQLVGERVDLVIWPEGATPYDPRAAQVGAIMGNLARLLKAPILFGGGFAEPRTDPVTGRKYVEQRNSIYLMSAEGEVVSRYDKMVPLPFGEYLPLADTFPILKEWIQGPGDFEAGSEPVTFALPGRPEVTFTSPICYEAILSRFVRTNLADAQMFVNVTNDGWFGNTAAPHQHAMLSAVRTMELGVPMVRLAYTGVSMTISPSGRIDHETIPFTEVARVIEVPVGRVSTVYARIGDVFAALCTAIAAGVVFRVFRRRPVTPGAAPS